MKCNAKLRRNGFSEDVSVLAVVFRRQFSKIRQFQIKLSFLIYWRNMTAGTETFTEKRLEHNSALHITFYLSIALPKILPHSKTIKSAKKLSEFCENRFRCLSNFLQTHIF